jgi:hypothetical protein
MQLRWQQQRWQQQHCQVTVTCQGAQHQAGH